MPAPVATIQSGAEFWVVVCFLFLFVIVAMDMQDKKKESERFKRRQKAARVSYWEDR